MQRKIALAALAALLGIAPAQAQDVKIGGLFGITGPIASLVPPIVESARLAIKQVNDQGGILKGGKLEMIIADGQCNPQASAAAAKKLVDVDKVAAIVGELCSGATIAAAEAAAIPGGVVLISPSATAPTMSTLKDNDFVFRTCPSDAFQGSVLAKYLMGRGIKKLALTYMNNDYGRGLAGAFRDAYKAAGGEITADLEHNEKAPSFRSELATLARGNPEYLLMIAYANSSGPVMLKQALEGGFFKKFIGSEGTRDPKLYEQIGIKNLEGMIISATGEPAGKNLDAFNAELAKVNKEFVNKPFTPHGYDAAFLLALAIEHAGSADRTKLRDSLRAIAKQQTGADVVQIAPGEWKKAKEAIAQKKPVFYTGAAGNHVFDKNGDVAGVTDIYGIKDGKEVKIDTLK
jgi:branched-chain amino acid transport system substrate-binding protein